MIPVTVNDLSAHQAIAFQFALLYDPAMANPVGPNFGCATAGTLSGAAGMIATCNVLTEGELRVVVYGAFPMSGSGSILDLSFVTGPGTAGGSSSIRMRDLAVFNVGGQIAATAADGSITVTVPTTPTPTPTELPTPIPTPSIVPTPTPEAPAGFEGDIVETPVIGLVEIDDLTSIRRLVAKLDSPVDGSDRFQKADTSPAVSKGDGYIDVSDIVQARRYADLLDILTPAGGPAAPAGPRPAAVATGTSSSTTIVIDPVEGQHGSRVTVPIRMVRAGLESASSFTLSFDPTMISISDIVLGEGTQFTDSVLTINQDRAEVGEIGIVLDSSASFTGDEILSLVLDIHAGDGTSLIKFDSSLVERSTSNTSGELVSTVYTDGVVTIRPAITYTSVSGHVLSPDGGAIRNAVVRLTDADGEVAIAHTSSFGVYAFDGLVVGRTYSLSVMTRRYRFVTRTVQISATIGPVNFIAVE